MILKQKGMSLILRYIYLYKKSTMYPSIPITNELISNSVVLSKHNIKGDVHILQDRAQLYFLMALLVLLLLESVHSNTSKNCCLFDEMKSSDRTAFDFYSQHIIHTKHHFVEIALFTYSDKHYAHSHHFSYSWRKHIFIV